MSDEHDELIGKTLAERYEITGLLGSGGMGSVYTAKQMPLGRQVALKVIRASLLSDRQTVERFKREATTVSQLLHPNVVTVYDFGQDKDGLLYIAMEHLPGENLRERLRRAGALTWQESLLVVRDIASGLDAAHNLGVIHRDLKPDNVMLINAGRKNFVKLLDFGVAKLIEQQSTDGHLTNTGMLVGTPGYMAPEQVLKGITTDPRSDLYAVGVLWFEMLTATTLFKAPTPVALVMKHANEPPPKVNERAPQANVPDGVEYWVSHLLGKDPNERPTTAAKLVEAIDELIVSTEGLSAQHRALSHSSGGFQIAPSFVQTDTAMARPDDKTVIDDEATLIHSNYVPPVSATPETGAMEKPGVFASSQSLTNLEAQMKGSKSRAPLAAALLAMFLVAGAVAFWFLNQGPTDEERCERGDAYACTLVADASPAGQKSAWQVKACAAGDQASCLRALEHDDSTLNREQLKKQACALGHQDSCPKKAIPLTTPPPVVKSTPDALAESANEKVPPEEDLNAKKTQRSKSKKRRTKRRSKKKPPLERAAETSSKAKVPGKHVPDLLFDDHEEKKKPKSGAHVPDLFD